MSRGRSAATILFSALLVVVLLFRLLFLFIGLKLKSFFRSRRFYRAMRRGGLDRKAARHFLGIYRRHDIPSFKRLASMAFEGRHFPYGRGNKRIY